MKIHQKMSEIRKNLFQVHQTLHTVKIRKWMFENPRGPENRLDLSCTQFGLSIEQQINTF